MKQDAFFQTIIHHIGGEGNVARKRFDGEHLYVTVKDSGMADLEELNRLDGVSGTELNRNILSVTIQEDFLEDVTMAKNFKQLAQNIMTLAGAKENVTSVFHCMTRLRMTVKDVKKVDQKAINDLDGVLGVTYQGGQLQVIIGKDLLKVYEEVLKLGYSDGGAVDEKLDGDLKGEKISVGQAVIGYISAAVQPMVPALIGGGMIKVFLLLISKVYAPFADSSTYTLLSIVGNAVFYFMPILVAYGAAKKLGATPTYSMVVAGALVAPEWTAIVSAGDPVTMFGINVALKGYGSSLLPALLLAIVAYYVEKFLNKVIPGVFKPIFVGTLTMAATYAVSILALAPLGQLAGTYVTAAILWLYNIAGPITVALFTALFPYMVMTGMHMTLGAPMIQLLSETGFDPLFRPGMLLSNMAEGGASLGIAIKAKGDVQWFFEELERMLSLCRQYGVRVIADENYPAEYAPVLQKMGNLSQIETTREKDPSAVGFLVKTTQYFVPMEGMIDIEAERKKLAGELEYLEGFLASVQKKLSNERFVSSAPEKVVANERTKQADAEAKIAALREQLAALK